MLVHVKDGVITEIEDDPECPGNHGTLCPEGLAGKCDLCLARLDRRLNPACVNACPAGCIYYGDTAEVFNKAGKPELLSRYKDISG